MNTDIVERIKDMLLAEDAVIIAHYYVPDEVKQIAMETGGIVADSLKMAQFGKSSAAKNLIVCGVRFMGETAKIINPEKRIFVTKIEATCSLDTSCSASDFAKWCAGHEDREKVVYINTSAEVKALADWVVTSSNALDIFKFLKNQGKKFLWAPDKYLGEYIKKHTEADMIIWDGSCVVHEEFKAAGIEQLKRIYPEAAVIAHPESPHTVTDMADFVGSTNQMLEKIKKMSNNVFIVATESKILFEMQREFPNKKFIIAPTMGEGATCRACSICPWMQMNNLEGIYDVLCSIHQQSRQISNNEILLNPLLIAKAKVSIYRMLNFSEEKK